jgi:hypothetical protein
MTVNYCETSRKSYSLAYDPQAADMALKCLGITMEQLIELVGIYKKGKNKGKLKGEFRYDEIIKGGWYKLGEYQDGFVTYKQKYNYQLVVLEYSSAIGQYALTDSSIKMIKKQNPDSIGRQQELNRLDLYRITINFSLENGHVETIKDSFQLDERFSLEKNIDIVISSNYPKNCLGCTYELKYPEV